MNINKYMTASMDNRPFMIRRVYVPSTSTAIAPQVVRCTWEPINTANLSSRPKSHTRSWTAPRSRLCTSTAKEHLRTNVDGDSYMIPSSFATANELRESDAHLFNCILMDGRSSQDRRKFYFDKLAGKNGIIRKMYNRSRPTNM